MLTMLNLYGKNLYKLSRLFLLIRPIWAVSLRRAGKTRHKLFLIDGSRSSLSVTWEELIIFTKDQHLCFILLKKISDLVISNSFPKVKKMKYLECQFPNELISNNIRNAPYYNSYLEMVAKHDQKVIAKKEGKKKTASAKQPKSKSATEKSSKPAPASKPKPTKEKPSKASTAKPPKLKPTKENSFQLVDEPDEEPTQPEPEPEPEPEQEGEVEGKGKAIVTEEQAAQSLLALNTPKRRSTTYQFIFQSRTPATEEASTGPSAQPQDDTSTNIVRDTPSPADAETGVDTNKTNSGDDTEILQFGDEQGDDVMEDVNLEDKTAEIGEDQAGSDPGETHES
ncbi:hypothetical protein Tco_0953033 [Tanacetum coccineum]|uniref:Uncharacterized protein n=1 Tax=Tanacetum coccineum TaxID=301880 RepID=A0ABQ5DZ60_9ASTR